MRIILPLDKSVPHLHLSGPWKKAKLEHWVRCGSVCNGHLWVVGRSSPRRKSWESKSKILICCAWIISWKARSRSATNTPKLLCQETRHHEKQTTQLFFRYIQMDSLMKAIDKGPYLMLLESTLSFSNGKGYVWSWNVDLSPHSKFWLQLWMQLISC